jgi:hypothetical protein
MSTRPSHVALCRSLSRRHAQTLDELGKRLRKRVAGIERKLHWRAQALQRQGDDLRERAAKEFAALNGWRLTKRDFNALTLMHNRVSDYHGNWVEDQGFLRAVGHRDYLDHAVYFHMPAHPHRTAAIVGQSYEHADNIPDLIPDLKKFLADPTLPEHHGCAAAHSIAS